MIQEIIGEKARIFDLDDTLIQRGKTTRVAVLLKGKFKPPHFPYLSLPEIAQLRLEHGRVQSPITSLPELLSYRFHATRTLYPGAVELLEMLAREEIAIYGNTGRSNKAVWIDMTEGTFEKGGVKDLFTDTFYTPEEVKTAISKAHALHNLSLQYKEVEYDEDDPRTVIYLARLFLLFPSVKINYRFHKITSLLVSASELKRYPNIRVLPALG